VPTCPVELPISGAALSAPHLLRTSMNAFQEASQIEAIARREILPWLHLKCESVEDTGDSLWLQKIVGDFIVVQEGRKRGIELKAEAKYTGNLFLETWSNLPELTPGWMLTSRADDLLYYFADVKTLYSIKLRRLQEWAFGIGEKEGHIYKYREVAQAKYQQINFTRGRLVPLHALEDARIPMRKYTADDRRQ